MINVSDETRIGAIRLKRSLDDKTFLSFDESCKVSPLANIKVLEDATKNIEKDNNVEKHIKDILSPGSSLGGARPKANVQILVETYI